MPRLRGAPRLISRSAASARQKPAEIARKASDARSRRIARARTRQSAGAVRPINHGCPRRHRPSASVTPRNRRRRRVDARSIAPRRIVCAVIKARAKEIADLPRRLGAMRIADRVATSIVVAQGRRPGVEVRSGIRWRTGDLWSQRHLWDRWRIVIPVDRWVQCIIGRDSGSRGAFLMSGLDRRLAGLPARGVMGRPSSASARLGRARQWGRALGRLPARACTRNLRPLRGTVLIASISSASARAARARDVRRWPLRAAVSSARGLALPAAGRCIGHSRGSATPRGAVRGIKG